MGQADTEQLHIYDSEVNSQNSWCRVEADIMMPRLSIPPVAAAHIKPAEQQYRIANFGNSLMRKDGWNLSDFRGWSKTGVLAS
jgi:hypothetical protein